VELERILAHGDEDLLECMQRSSVLCTVEEDVKPTSDIYCRSADMVLTLGLEHSRELEIDLSTLKALG
jgi:hypothetical protein